MTYRTEKDFEIVVPREVKKIVVMDDKGYEWVKDQSKKKVSLPGNTTLTVVDVEPNSTIQYGYQSILVKRPETSFPQMAK